MKSAGFTTLAKYPDGLIMVHGWFDKKKDRDEQMLKHQRSYPQYTWAPYSAKSYLDALDFVRNYNKSRVEDAKLHAYHIVERGRNPIEDPKRIRLINTFMVESERDQALLELRKDVPHIQFGPLNQPGYNAAASWVNARNLKLSSK